MNKLLIFTSLATSFTFASISPVSAGVEAVRQKLGSPEIKRVMNPPVNPLVFETLVKGYYGAAENRNDPVFYADIIDENVSTIQMGETVSRLERGFPDQTKLSAAEINRRVLDAVTRLDKSKLPTVKYGNGKKFNRHDKRTGLFILQQA